MIELWSINYANARTDTQPVGGIAKCFVAGWDDQSILPACYADMRAMHDVWQRKPSDIVGFHGYRKHIDLSADRDTARWVEVHIDQFRAYQMWLAGPQPAPLISALLDEHQIIITPPYRVDTTIEEDFKRTRSAHDFAHLKRILGPSFDYKSQNIYDMFFITRWGIFNAYMHWWWDVVRELEPLARGGLVDYDTPMNEAYPRRYMAFLSQTIFSLWLENMWDVLKPVVISRLTCWDAH